MRLNPNTAFYILLSVLMLAVVGVASAEETDPLTRTVCGPSDAFVQILDILGIETPDSVEVDEDGNARMTIETPAGKIALLASPHGVICLSEMGRHS